MGNHLKRCFAASSEETKPSAESNENTTNTSPAKEQQEATADDKKEKEETTVAASANATAVPVTTSTTSESTAQQKEEGQAQKKEEIKPTPLPPAPPRNFPKFSGVSTTHLSTPPAENPKNKYSSEVDAKFFQKAQPARKPLNRNLEWYEAKNISGAENGGTNQGEDFVHYLRGPDDIQDQRVSIEGCSNGAKFVIADECDSVQIDECKDCSFYIGPTAGSVFARNCTNCSFVVVCSQLRLRDCKQCYIELFTATKPVIESSSEIGFARWRGPEYSDLRRQMAKAKLSVLNNKWWQIHDFTPSSSSLNYILFHDDSDENEEEKKSLQEFISRCRCPPINSLVFTSCLEEEGNRIENANIGTASKEEEEIFRKEPQTIPRILSKKNHLQQQQQQHSNHVFICFQPGSFDTAIKFCLRHSSSNENNINNKISIKYAVETKFKDEKMLASFFEGLVERLQSQGDEGKAKLKQVGQLLLNNVACCVVVEEKAEVEGEDESKLSFTDEEISNIAVYLDSRTSADDQRMVKMLTHTVFLSQQATGGSGFGQAFASS